MNTPLYTSDHCFVPTLANRTSIFAMMLFAIATNQCSGQDLNMSSMPLLDINTMYTHIENNDHQEIQNLLPTLQQASESTQHEILRAALNSKNAKTIEFIALSLKDTVSITAQEGMLLHAARYSTAEDLTKLQGHGFTSPSLFSLAIAAASQNPSTAYDLATTMPQEDKDRLFDTHDCTCCCFCSPRSPAEAIIMEHGCGFSIFSIEHENVFEQFKTLTNRHATVVSCCIPGDEDGPNIHCCSMRCSEPNAHYAGNHHAEKNIDLDALWFLTILGQPLH